MSTSTRSIVIILAILFLGLQYKLWFSSNGVAETFQMKGKIAEQTEINKQLNKKNKTIAQQIKELQQGQGTVQSLARNDLGMVKKGETYYQFVS